MPGSRKPASLGAVLFLLAALLLSPVFETHEPRGHLPDGAPAFGEAAVYVAGHSMADRSLHIESLGSVESSHCVGCLLRESRRGFVVHKERMPRAALAVPLFPQPVHDLSAGPSRSSSAPRAPPLLRSHSS